MLPFLSVLQYLVLTLWVGAMFGFGVLFAPVMFRIIKSRDVAGTITAETLARIDSLGLVTGGIMLVITALQSIDSHWQSLDLGRLLAAAAMLALVLVSSVTIRQKMNVLRQQMGRPIDEVPQTDPLRLEYGRMHRVSRFVYGANMLLGTLLIVLSALRPVA